MKRIILLFCLVLCCLSSCKEVYRYTTNTFFAMNTVVNTVVSEKIGDDSTEKILSELENKLSRTKPDSEISLLNSGEDVTLSDETFMIIEKSLEIARDTDYAFNPCMGTLTDLWDITSGKNVVPTDEQIKAALSHCNAEQVVIENGRVILPDGMKIDLGGVAKGYALERSAENLSQKAMGYAVGADFCISLGGNVAVMGASQSRKTDGLDGWNVGITNPFDKNEIFGTLLLGHGYVSVSGAYERYFEKDGKSYHHIFDSKTGYPAESDLASAAVISNDGLCADALSTALFVMGRHKAIEFYKGGRYDFEMILVTNDGEVLVSEGIYDNFSLSGGASNINEEKLTIINR